MPLSDGDGLAAMDGFEKSRITKEGNSRNAEVFDDQAILGRWNGRAIYEGVHTK